MKIAICDDEKVFVDKITELLLEVDPILQDSAIVQFANGIELMEYIESNEIDAAILDIAMPGMDGFEVAKELQEKNKNISLLFVSSKEELVFQSYEYHPFWFVPKSQLISLPDVLTKFVEKLKVKKQQNDFVRLTFHKKVIELDINTLIYFESHRHYLTMVTTNGRQVFRGKIADAESQLQNHRLVRCHVGYLVNCKKISEIQKSTLVLMDGSKVPISRNRMAETKHAFQDYLRSERW